MILAQPVAIFFLRDAAPPAQPRAGYEQTTLERSQSQRHFCNGEIDEKPGGIYQRAHHRA